MPTNRVRKARGTTLDEWRRSELLAGAPCLLGGLGYFNYQTGKFDVAAMERDWTRHRESLMAEWRAAHDDDSKPYAWHLFDA